MVWGDLGCAFREFRRTALVLGTLCAASALAGCGSGSAQTASDESCTTAVLDDWGDDGSVDATHEPDCYLAAIDALPPDVRAYTSAADDIFRALHARRLEAVARNDDVRILSSVGTPASTAPTPERSAGFRRPPEVVMLLGAVGLVLTAGAAGLSLTRRVRRTP